MQPRPEKNLKDSILEATPTPRDIRGTKKLNTFMQDLHPHHTQRSSGHQSKNDIVIHPNGIKDQVCTHICQKEHIAEPFFKHFNKVLKELISYSKGIDSSDLISDLKLIQKYSLRLFPQREYQNSFLAGRIKFFERIGQN